MHILIAGNPELTKNYEAALQALRVPFTVSLSPESAASCDRLLLPGGGDVDPALFGQENKGSRTVDPELDRAQLALLSLFVQAGKPVLGICKGMQVLNIYFGGNVIQDLATNDLHQWNGQDQIHPAHNLSGSILYRLYGPSCQINSAHHQGLGQIGSNFRIAQLAPDGIVEAIEDREKPFLGVQWHPERAGFAFSRPGLVNGETLISYFLEQM